MEFDFAQARAFLANKRAMREKRQLDRCNQACRDAERIIRMLIRDYDPERIYQWGSLLDPKKFCEFSDIDIAVEGIKSAEAFFKLFGEADDMTGFPLDLVEMEKIHPLHAESIRNKGRLVYEKSES